MKTTYSFLITLLIISIFSCKNNTDTDQSRVTDTRTLLSLIQDPPATYRAAPLWDWNDKITREEIEFQLNQFHQGGIGGVFIHPRPGLVTEYLSKDWNELFQFTVQTAKKLGMLVWIYDENSYPSGFAGGHVQARYPDSYKHGTGLGLKITQDLNEITELPVEVLLRKSNQNATSSESATYYVFYRTYPQPSYWYGGFPYVDLLLPGVTDTFMRATMEGYEKYNREEFGKTLPGIFTDEPNLEAAKGPGTVIRWTPELFDEFEFRWGYRLEPELVSLVEETDNYTKVRHDYYTLLLEMFLDKWAVPWFNYCEANNLDWTGHYWEHGWPYPGDGIDESAFYMYHQVPGVDMLGRSYDPTGMDGQFGNTRAIRELGSAANQAGWNRRLSETYGGAGWQISFAELKRLVDWEVVLGVNFVNPHLSYYSLQGVRKFDYPPSFSYHEPWWENFSLLGDYIGRICLAMSAGEQINNTLVIQPNSTAWMYHSTLHNDSRIHNLSVEFKKFVQELEKNQIEYDLGSEQVLRRFGESTHGGLKIRNRTYDHLILPPGIRNIETSTLNLIREYLSDGYTILSFSDSIDYVDGSPNSAVKELETRYPVNWIRERKIGSGHIKTFFLNPDFSVKQTDTLRGQLFHQRRILDDGELIFLVNANLESETEAELEIKGRHLTNINLESGVPGQMPHQKKNGMLNCKATLPPGGSLLLLVTNKPVNYETEQTDRLDDLPENSPQDDLSEEILKPVEDVSVKPLSPNILTIDYLDLENRMFKKKDMYFMTAMYKLFELSGLPTGNPWQHKIQYRQQYLELDSFSSDSWFKAKYHFSIDNNLPVQAVSSLRAVIERPDQWKVSLNGKAIEPESGKWWLDKHFPVYQIGEYVKKGENVIELSATRMTVFSELMPMYILGDFSLAAMDKGFLIQTSQNIGYQSWKDCGMPFYGNKVSYQASYSIDDPNNRYRVRLGEWKGTVAEVIVNGKLIGEIGWHPYEIDVTSQIVKGINTIEIIITGSLKNTLGYHHVIQTGWIDSPFSWNQGPENQPPGSSYHFLDYGLTNGFSLIKSISTK